MDIKPGNLLVGLASSGPHTNGYSLIRKVFNEVSLEHIYPELGQPLGNILLEPHRSYFPVLKAAIECGILKGLAHITGGGFMDNIPRILPQGCGAHINKNGWEIPPLFQLIENLGIIDPDEMYRVFNMGIGMVAVIESQNLDEFQSSVGEKSWIIGEVTLGESVILE
jgi:phosphoribosylformylglycinamidine cyclo-ligase/phosphoribosylamine--glycine ligase/phosphoribosylformylglycinamidine cyclo-ligase